MPFDIEDLNPVTRFNWDSDGAEWVELRLVPDDEMEKIRKTVGIKSKVKYLSNPQTKRMDRVDDIDFDETKLTNFNEALLNYQICNWNLVTSKGNKIECSLENKKMMMYGSPKFAKWINANLDKLRLEIDGIEEVELKN